ncbi:hypothetical protein FH5_00002 [Priestia endophytica]|jgi:hypothetical protein|nr:hypothetical protein FH5_00002 [Priestia endophytica]
MIFLLSSSQRIILFLLFLFPQQYGPIVEQEVKGGYILVMYNMYPPLFFRAFYDLGLDKILSGKSAYS